VRELFELALASGRLSCITLNQIVAFGSVIPLPNADLCSPRGRAGAYLPHGRIFSKSALFGLEHASRTRILLA